MRVLDLPQYLTSHRRFQRSGCRFTAAFCIMIFSMHKTAAAASGPLLVVGKAAAVSTSETARVGDRAGATAELAGVPLPALLIGSTWIIATDCDLESG